MDMGQAVDVAVIVVATVVAAAVAARETVAAALAIAAAEEAAIHSKLLCRLRQFQLQAKGVQRLSRHQLRHPSSTCIVRPRAAFHLREPLQEMGRWVRCQHLL